MNKKVLSIRIRPYFSDLMTRRMIRDIKKYNVDNRRAYTYLIERSIRKTYLKDELMCKKKLDIYQLKISVDEIIDKEPMIRKRLYFNTDVYNFLKFNGRHRIVIEYALIKYFRVIILNQLVIPEEE